MSLAGNAERLGVDITGKWWSGGQPVLGAIQFTLSVGEIVAIAGPSGCGKSTLMGILAGHDKDYQGRVLWCGQPRMGIVFQSPRLLPWRTATQNVALALGGGRTAQRLAREALAEVGLDDAADTYPARLSVGMARRVAFARALVAEPDVLLLDEAFVSLDDAAADGLRAIVLAAIEGRGMSVLMISHDTRESEEMANRLLVLGGSPARLVAEHRMNQGRGAAERPTFFPAGSRFRRNNEE